MSGQKSRDRLHQIIVIITVIVTVVIACFWLSSLS